MIINGTNDDDWFGASVASAGDVNNDNYDEVIVGAERAEDAGTMRGRAFCGERLPPLARPCANEEGHCHESGVGPKPEAEAVGLKEPSSPS